MEGRRVWLGMIKCTVGLQTNQCADMGALRSGFAFAELVDVDNIDGMHKAVR